MSTDPTTASSGSSCETCGQAFTAEGKPCKCTNQATSVDNQIPKLLPSSPNASNTESSPGEKLSSPNQLITGSKRESYTDGDLPSQFKGGSRPEETSKGSPTSPNVPTTKFEGPPGDQVIEPKNVLKDQNPELGSSSSLTAESNSASADKSPEKDLPPPPAVSNTPKDAPDCHNPEVEKECSQKHDQSSLPLQPPPQRNAIELACSVDTDRNSELDDQTTDIDTASSKLATMNIEQNGRTREDKEGDNGEQFQPANTHQLPVDSGTPSVSVHGTIIPKAAEKPHPTNASVTAQESAGSARNVSSLATALFLLMPSSWSCV